MTTLEFMQILCFILVIVILYMWASHSDTKNKYKELKKEKEKNDSSYNEWLWEIAVKVWLNGSFGKEYWFKAIVKRIDSILLTESLFRQSENDLKGQIESKNKFIEEQNKLITEQGDKIQKMTKKHTIIWARNREKIARYKRYFFQLDHAIFNYFGWDKTMIDAFNITLKKSRKLGMKVLTDHFYEVRKASHLLKKDSKKTWKNKVSK